jgi:hypothetical protein
MKRFKTLLLIAFISTYALGQIDNVEKLMTRKYLSCEDINYNVKFLIPSFYDKGNTDTLYSVLDYWENHCGNSEELTRCKIIFSIDKKEFNEKIYDSNILNYLLSYRNGSNSMTYGYNNFYNNRYGWNNYVNRIDTLDKFTVRLATKLLKRTDLKPLEIFFLRLYSNDFENPFLMIPTEAFNGTLIQKLYCNEIKTYENQIIPHGDLILGAWIPFNSLKIVGSHPYIGFRGGIKYKKIIADLTLAFKPGNSPNVYQVYENDSLWNTNHFFGGYLGLDLAYELFKIKKSSFDMIGGIAFDGFDVLESNEQQSNNEISKSINSLNLNFGLGYKYHLNQWTYWGFDLKYNFVNYKNTRGTDLSGNALTINLIYGFCANQYNVNRLEQLGYKK